MSGAEFLAVAPLIQSGLGLLGFVKNVIDRINHFSKDIREVPQKFVDLKDSLALLHLTLKRTKDRAASLSQSDREVLNSVVGACESRIHKVTEIFHKYHLTEPAKSSYQTLLKAIKSVAKDDDVVKLVGEIEQHLKYIFAHSITLAPTTEEISDVITPEVLHGIDRRFSKMVKMIIDAQKSAPPLPASSSSSVHSGDLDQSNKGHHINAQSITYNYYGLPNTSVVGHIGGPHGPIPQLSTSSLRTDATNLASPIQISEHDLANGISVFQFEPSVHDLSRLGVDRALSGHSARSSHSRRDRSSSCSSGRSTTSSIQSHTSGNSTFSTTKWTPAFGSPLSDPGMDPLSPISAGDDRLDKHVLALKEANSLLAKADGLVPTPSMLSTRIKAANAEARAHFYQAVAKFTSIPAYDPLLALRRHRGLTYAALGLTKVTKGQERDDFIELAVSHTNEARTAARRCGNLQGSDDAYARNAISKVALDRASVKARQARITEKKRAASDIVTKMRMEAFRTYEGVADEYDGGCSCADDYDVYAQAQLGCLEVAQTLQGSLGVAGRAAHGVEEPWSYFEKGKMGIRAAIGVPGTTAEAKQAVELTWTRLKSSLKGQAC